MENALHLPSDGTKNIGQKPKVEPTIDLTHPFHNLTLFCISLLCFQKKNPHLTAMTPSADTAKLSVSGTALAALLACCG
jgi:hypothetical protein